MDHVDRLLEPAPVVTVATPPMGEGAVTADGAAGTTKQ